MASPQVRPRKVRSRFTLSSGFHMYKLYNSFLLESVHVLQEVVSTVVRAHTFRSEPYLHQMLLRWHQHILPNMVNNVSGVDGRGMFTEAAQAASLGKCLYHITEEEVEHGNISHGLTGPHLAKWIRAYTNMDEIAIIMSFPRIHKWEWCFGI